MVAVRIGHPILSSLSSNHLIDAEYCLLRSEATVRVPTDVDPAEFAPQLCAGVTVFNGIRQMKITPGEIVAIQGLGGLGHLAVQYAAKMGYRVVALSSSASKEKFAKELGASDYIDGSKQDHGETLQKLGGAALVVATAPNTEVMKGLIHGLAPQGKLLILAGKFITLLGWDEVHPLLTVANSRWRSNIQYNPNDPQRPLSPRLAIRPRTRLRRDHYIRADPQRQLHD